MKVRTDPQENGISVFFQVTTERKRTEEKINALLKEKELLLREVHHRIKNNMLTIGRLAGKLGIDDVSAGGPKVDIEFDVTVFKEFKSN